MRKDALASFFQELLKDAREKEILGLLAQNLDEEEVLKRLLHIEREGG